jgi:hypothetical protein
MAGTKEEGKGTTRRSVTTPSHRLMFIYVNETSLHQPPLLFTGTKVFAPEIS